MFAFVIVVAAAATATVAKEIAFDGVAGAAGEALGVPARTVKVTLFNRPL
jgi:hypothetical protein